MNRYKLSRPSAAVFLALATSAALAMAQHHGSADHGAAHSKDGGVVGSGQMIEGELRKVDVTAKKVTIHHGEIKHMGMPSMTMVFQVRDAALLTKAKGGDKVRFRAENQGGAMVLVGLEVVQ